MSIFDIDIRVIPKAEWNKYRFNQAYLKSTRYFITPLSSHTVLDKVRIEMNKTVRKR